MNGLIAHGSGIDEILVLLAVPALFLISLAYKSLRRRFGSRDGAEHPDDAVDRDATKRA